MLLSLLLLLIAPSISVFCLFLFLLGLIYYPCLVRSICICCILVSCLLRQHLLWLIVLHLMPLYCPLHLRLLYFGKLFTPFASSVTCSIYVCYLCLVCSVCIYFASVSYLLVCIFCGLFYLH